jgi:hypothetical protein
MPIPSRSRPAWVASLVFAAVSAVAATPGLAWIDTGHKVVAFVAWEELTPATRAAATAILKGHPRYDKDLLSGGTLEAVPAAETAALSPAEVDRRVFAAAAVWPDLIKAPSHPFRIRLGHSNWHFIDLPYVVPTTRPGDAAAEPPAEARKGSGPQNIVEALTQCTAELRDPATPADQRAYDLCWVIHLVGDIHQPLHACSLFDAQFPKGDQGGNSEVVLKDGRYQNTKHNLHLIWDSLPGDFATDDLDRFEANGLHGDPAYARSTYPQLGVTDFMAWAKESQQLAIDDAYLDGHLTAATGGFGDRTAQGVTVPALPPGYMRNAEHVAMRQVTLAGYRLADLLNGLLDPTAKR